MDSMDTSRVGLKPPPTPSKWEVIPIHTSDRGVFKDCRRRWGWSSPTRLNLVPKANVYGITMPLWFGTGIHYALERYYHPGLREDPVNTFAAWYDLQWNGGLIHESELSGYLDRKPVRHSEHADTYIVSGLQEILPDPDPEIFEAHRLLGVGMMEYYKMVAPRNDNFSVIMVEHDFSVPILTPEGNPLHWKDHRLMPKEYEHLYGAYKPVHARGRMDNVCQDNETGQYGVIDYKTASKIDDDYFRYLDLDPQSTTYAWAAESEAKTYDLEYKRIDFIILVALRKAYPQPPTMTSRGLPSIDRQNESTTAVLFEQCIKDHGLEAVFATHEKLQSYYSYLVEMGDKLFIQRDVVRRNEHEISNCGIDLYFEAVDMLDDPALYHNPSKNYSCLNCAFRAPCVAKQAGYDWEGMLEDGYESNYDR